MEDAAIVKARTRAEASVSDMPDGPLKIAAFQVILGRLLEAGNTSASRAPQSAPATTVKGRTDKSSAPGRPTSLVARILQLRDEDFFAAERSIGEVRDELKVHGWVYPITSLSGSLQGLVQRRELRRALVSDGKKKIFKYVTR